MLSDLLAISSSNTTAEEDKLTLGFDTFALQLQDIDLDFFNGQTFSVNLGPVEDALNSVGSLSEALKTSEMIRKIAENSTATVQVPATSFEMIEECNATESNAGRLSYSVFLTDILFQSRNQSGRGLDIGSIIVTTRLRCAENVSLPNPITVIFRTIEEV